MKLKSFLMVAIQLGCIAWLILSGPVRLRAPWLLLLAAGMGLGGWALLAMRWRRLKILPEPAAHTQLVTAGPYRFIRHPMYSAVLLVTLALLGNAFTGLRLAVWLILLADLLAKLSYEERLLAKRFPDYAMYRTKTWRLAPGVY